MSKDIFNTVSQKHWSSRSEKELALSAMHEAADSLYYRISNPEDLRDKNSDAYKRLVAHTAAVQKAKKFYPDR